MRAKFYVSRVTNHMEDYQEARLCIEDDGNPENNQFANTPIGEITIGIDNPAARDFFKPGRAYYVDFTEAP